MACAVLFVSMSYIVANIPLYVEKKYIQMIDTAKLQCLDFFTALLFCIDHILIMLDFVIAHRALCKKV